ncbi:hypothetical protein ANN_23027 [Periplaneta americana]|uniref:DDE-1 domain-containing protein n=1 Tax=Periplaneta americana TaxID=6978 RepID=A0ABQ8SL24_PERAM|nr:hypothetical protein ANN_23027 [Periplaneta americana]
MKLDFIGCYPVRRLGKRLSVMACSNAYGRHFVSSVIFCNEGLPLKVILLIDNTLPHPGIELISGNIKVKFLPPNVTALLQLTDQGMLENIKHVYKRQLLSKLIEGKAENGVISHLKSVNVKDVIYMVASAWDHVAELTIKKCWKKI